ncbi:MAG: alpha/beta hydrolase [Syntrophales bacterium]|jgi:pimeloyl-ACP methyl ester carboxylesterase|nr:alpha/beta hydrolase [Syntrophales bacterium]MCK9527852.1 alpha/beta hydrolase [Syntrophales bacterium]MDX9922050.1 alpha/beta hydrolase [Syntrophales bacterium]
MPFFTTNDHVGIFYEDRGTGRSVVLIHGLTANHSHFRKQIPALSRHFRIIACDLRGHGDSGRPADGITIPRLARDLNELITFLDLAEVTLVGWSLGGQVIFEYIKQFGCGNLHKITIVDMAPRLLKSEDWNFGLRGLNGRFGDFTHEDNLSLMSLMCEDWEQYCRLLVPRLFNRTDMDRGTSIFEDPGYPWKDDLDWLLEEARRNSPHVILFLWISMMMQDYRPQLAGISVPCLLVWGGESTYYGEGTYAFMKNALVRSPEVRSVAFENCGHALHIQNPERFNRILIDFITAP